MRLRVFSAATSMQQNNLIYVVCIILSLCVLFLITRPTDYGCSEMNSSRILVKTEEKTTQIQSAGGFAKPSARMIRIYKEQAEARRISLKGVLDRKEREFLTFYNVIVPEVFCAELVRIGNVGDGGKWMCSPHDLPADCTVLSLGLNNAIQFDVHLQTVSQKRCNLVGYDSADQNEATKNEMASINGKSFVGLISGVSGADNRISLEDIQKKHMIKKIEILKIDIEGSEFQALIPFLQKNVISQILIEIHSGGAASRFLDLLVPLSKLGYWIASYEINGAWHELSEFSFLHESAFSQYKATPLARYMDF